MPGGKRAARVCEPCHSHKVRCDVQPDKKPCSRCAAIGETCRIRERKKYPVRKKRRCSTVKASGSEESQDAPATVPSLLHARIVAAAIPKPSARTTPIFVGNGGYGKILDAVGGSPQRLFEVHAASEQPLPAEDLAYLKTKGCFALPEQSEELLQAYFRYVHPTFPVIDGSFFLQKFAASGLEGVNLLLLWSMFSASASYVPTLPRKACKASFVQKAKLLYDISQEHDKIVLVQSALLLSFYFADTEDVKQSWYWTSIAFGIAQSLGLHHDAKTNGGRGVTQERSWWRTIWQCCLIRDVWLAFGMGRPLRILDLNYSRNPLQQLDCRFADVKLGIEQIYSEQEAIAFERMWQSLVNVSNMLRGVLTNTEGSTVNDGIFQSQVTATDGNPGSPLISHAQWHLHLHQYAMAIALAQAKNDESQVEDAVSGSIATVKAMLDDGTTNFASPVTLPLVVPAMVHSLNSAKSKEPDTKRVSNYRLEVISSFFHALEDSYAPASILVQVLKTARSAITSGEELHSGTNGDFPYLSAWSTGRLYDG